jgi:hypothetical protein
MSERNIPGIYNYCDRWCERCPFTGRCAVYESESVATPLEVDVKNKAFWDRLSQNFAKARVMLEDAAKEHGIDMESVMENIDEVQKNEAAIEQEIEKHSLILMAKEYREFTDQWLKTQPGMMDKLEKLKENLTMGTESHEDAKIQTETIKDSLSVIEWYKHFLEVKLNRALRGRADAAEFNEDNDSPHDYDGSAKIAVIGVERSMQAWARLFDLLPDQEDTFLKVLALLERMKTKIVLEFPSAMEFVRPGFDEAL